MKMSNNKLTTLKLRFSFHPFYHYRVENQAKVQYTFLTNGFYIKSIKNKGKSRNSNKN